MYEHEKLYMRVHTNTHTAHHPVVVAAATSTQQASPIRTHGHGSKQRVIGAHDRVAQADDRPRMDESNLKTLGRTIGEEGRAKRQEGRLERTAA